MVVVINLFPGEVLQLWDVLQNGYWHARGPELLHQPFMRTIEWLRLPGDLVFIALGVLPALLAASLVYSTMWRPQMGLAWHPQPKSVPPQKPRLFPEQIAEPLACRIAAEFGDR